MQTAPVRTTVTTTSNADAESQEKQQQRPSDDTNSSNMYCSVIEPSTTKHDDDVYNSSMPPLPSSTFGAAVNLQQMHETNCVYGCSCVPNNIPSLFEMAERRKLYKMQQEHQRRLLEQSQHLQQNRDDEI